MHKTTASPKRCLKCQQFGHYISDCKASNDRCTCCSSDHHTNLCPSTDDSLKCTNCTGQQANGHGVADRDYPSFITETKKLHQCNPEYKYKFFPTNEPATQKLLMEPDIGQFYILSQANHHLHQQCYTKPAYIDSYQPTDSHPHAQGDSY